MAKHTENAPEGYRPKFKKELKDIEPILAETFREFGLFLSRNNRTKYKDEFMQLGSCSYKKIFERYQEKVKFL